MADWDSVGVFGPLSVHPDLWNKGIAEYLLKSTMEYFTELGTRHIGLFTWAHEASLTPSSPIYYTIIIQLVWMPYLANFEFF